MTSAQIAKQRLMWCAFFDDNRKGRVFFISVSMLREWQTYNQGKPFTWPS